LGEGFEEKELAGLGLEILLNHLGLLEMAKDFGHICKEPSLFSGSPRTGLSK